MNFERKSSVQRVVGKAHEAYKEGVLKGRGNQFRNQIFEGLEGKEKKKTPEQIQIIQDVDVATNELLAKYALPAFSIPPENVHIIHDDQWHDKESAGFFRPIAQAIAVREQPTNTVFMATVFHEMIHFKSYGAEQADVEGGDLRRYRVGLSLQSRTKEKGHFFTAINEAVTEELTKKHARSLLRHPVLRGEIEETRRTIREYPNAISYRTGERLLDEDTFCATSHVTKEWNNAVWRYFGTSVGLKNVDTKIMVQKFSYPKERQALKILVSKIFQENKDGFTNEDEVFEIFAKAMMTGNMLPLGKVIDKTFGVGVFRKIGEYNEDVEGLKTYIETL